MHGDADGSWLIRNAAAYRHLERQPVGDELLTIEAAIMPGKGRVTVTGNLRDVKRLGLDHPRRLISVSATRKAIQVSSSLSILPWRIALARDARHLASSSRHAG